MFAGFLANNYTFAEIVNWLGLVNLLAIVAIVCEGCTTAGLTGGFWGRKRDGKWTQKYLSDGRLDSLLLDLGQALDSDHDNSDNNITGKIYASNSGMEVTSSGAGDGDGTNVQRATPGVDEQKETEGSEGSEEEVESSDFTWWWAVPFCVACVALASVGAFVQASEIESRCADFYASPACGLGQPTALGSMGNRQLMGLYDDKQTCAAVASGKMKMMHVVPGPGTTQHDSPR